MGGFFEVGRDVAPSAVSVVESASPGPNSAPVVPTEPSPSSIDLRLCIATMGPLEDFVAVAAVVVLVVSTGDELLVVPL